MLGTRGGGVRGIDRAEQAMEKWRDGDHRPKSRPFNGQSQQPGRKYYHELTYADAEDGFCKRTVVAVHCTKCGAEKGQWCRTSKGYEHRGIVMLCPQRRALYLSVLSGDLETVSDTPLSSVMDGVSYTIPVNKQAAYVASGCAQWTRSGGSWRGFGPLKTRPLPRDTPSLIGVVSGDLTCIGLSASHKSNSSASGRAIACWICRCSCGYYVLRTGRALRNASSKDCCEVCHRLKRLKRQDYFNQNGVWPDEHMEAR